jgi:hypothetical protein
MQQGRASDNKRSPPSCPSTFTYNNKKLKAMSSTSVKDVVNDDGGTEINNEGLSALTLLGLPFPIRVAILNYLGQTQDDLVNSTLVSKKVNEDCKRPGIEWKIIRTIEFSPTKGGSVLALLQQLCHHPLDNDTNKLRRYPHMKVNDGHEFYFVPSIEIHKIISYTHNEITKYVEMDWILSLDMSLSALKQVISYLPSFLSLIFPKLREIDLTNTSGPIMLLALRNFSRRCPHLEKVTWNNIDMNTYVKLNGDDIRFSNIGNLKEIIMDDSDLCCSSVDRGIDKMSALGNHRDTFLFHHCSNALESVSIRNAKCFNTRFNYRNYNLFMVPQNVLIKFVRSVPSLRWFRSDLTQQNMDMLRLERPGIELLN